MILIEGYGIIQVFKIPFFISLAPLAVGSGEGFLLFYPAISRYALVSSSTAAWV